MTTFYFVRHGQTLVNVNNGFNGGIIDKPLTALGVSGAKAVGHALSQVHFTQVLTSSMPRTLTTTALIMQENRYAAQTPVQPVNALREMVLGSWEGKTAEENNDPAGLDLFFNDFPRFDAEVAPRIGAEPFQHVAERTLPVIQTAVAAHPPGTILVVAHGLVFRMLLNALQGRTWPEAKVGDIMRNATITTFTTRDGQHFAKGAWDVDPADFTVPAAK